MDFNSLLTNIYLWMILTFLFLILFIILFILLFIIAKKTHGIVEFKAWMKGIPICLFFQDSGYVEWKPSKPENNLIDDKKFGTFIINETGTYIDRRTKNIIIPFDAAYAGSINVKAAKVADDLQHIIQDRKQFLQLRQALLTGQLEDDNNRLEGLKTSVQISAIKAYLTAMIPHNITAKINMAIASKLKGFGKIDTMQFLLIFGGVLGAIIIGYILLKSVGGV